MPTLSAEVVNLLTILLGLLSVLSGAILLTFSSSTAKKQVLVYVATYSFTALPLIFLGYNCLAITLNEAMFQNDLVAYGLEDGELARKYVIEPGKNVAILVFSILYALIHLTTDAIEGLRARITG